MSGETVQDEVLYCARCGISFLWSQEEQHTGDTAQPRLCPGCRILLPPPGRERGLVKWYNKRKQFGFLIRTGQPDLYVHRSGVADGRPLQPGDLVEFAVVATDRGPAAVEVRLVLAGDAADAQ